MTRKTYIEREAAEYMANGTISMTEREELLDWIESGNSVLTNPWLMADERGNPMDYLSAVRTAEELRIQHLECHTS